jgi:ketopantoate reductase
VTLFNRSPERIAGVKARGGLELESYKGGPYGFARLAAVTSHMTEALEEADVVHVVVPSSAHAEVAKSAAPYLRGGQIVVLHPGRTLGAIEFNNVLCENGCTMSLWQRQVHSSMPAALMGRPRCASSHWRRCCQRRCQPRAVCS